MQKSFIAITLALSLTCTLAYYNAQSSYVKAPVPASADNDTNYTNAATLQLISANIGELDLLASNTTSQAATTSAWSAIYKKLDGKTLSATNNYSVVALTGGMSGASSAWYINGYAISYSVENDSNNIPQISISQTPIGGGTALAKVWLTSNNNTNYTPAYITKAVISKNVYVFWNASATANGTLTRVNVTNFVAGSTKGTVDFNITNGYTSGLQVVWGEALGSNQLFANWMEGGVLKDATIDVSKATATASVVGNWTVNFTCTVFSTDKKWFGDLCYDSKTTSGNTTFYVRYNTNASLLLLNNNFTNANNWVAVYPYGPYIAITYYDFNISTIGNITYSYDIWNLDSFTQNKNRTTFLTIDANSYSSIFRVTSGGLYTLLANKGLNGTTIVNYTSIQVGLVLGSSYLTSVLGFILTIVAGLLLF